MFLPHIGRKLTEMKTIAILSCDCGSVLSSWSSGKTEVRNGVRPPLGPQFRLGQGETPATNGHEMMETGFSVSDAAATRIGELIATEPGATLFRVAVNGGGCSGFQYEFGFAQAAEEDDIIIQKGPAKVAVDQVSLPFLAGAEIDWVEDLIGSSFKIRNPNAKSSCGCGISFSV